MAVNATSDASRFEYAGSARLPIGVETPATVDLRDVSEVKAAMLKLGEVADKGRGTLSPESARALALQENYYLWALGVTGLAVGGSDDDARMLLETYDGPTSLRQILWLEYCFENVFPISARPPLELRHRQLLRHLDRMANTAPQRHEQKPTSRPAAVNSDEQ